MKEGGSSIKFGNRFISFMFKLFFSLFSGVWLLILAVMMLYGWKQGDLEFGVIALVAGAFCGVLALMYLILMNVATGELTEEGIYIRVFLRRRFYPWASIRQAGVLWRMGRGWHYNDLVLLKSGGSPRRYRDWSFPLRNFFFLICLGDSPAIRDYVIRRYGPLDFDLSDGRPEKSIVMD